FKVDRGWNINLSTARLYANSVCVGAGRAITRASEGRPNLYTRKIFERALSKEYAHSVRDEKSKDYLESLGFKAINTGCPTTWCLTPELAAEIPATKASSVVTTLTDYAVDRDADSFLLDTLLERYETVSCWVQGSTDLAYLTSFKQSSHIDIIPPSLSAYSSVLNRDDTEYVGTRLHAGIYAMQHRTRSLIISVDNRASDMASSNGIPVLSRENREDLGRLIDSERATNLHVDLNSIEKWKSQFTANHA
ncbi:MAG: polysaccharide pyruvyl transferase family protein, partial [Leucobacter sp.]